MLYLGGAAKPHQPPGQALWRFGCGTPCAHVRIEPAAAPGAGTGGGVGAGGRAGAAEEEDEEAEEEEEQAPVHAPQPGATPKLSDLECRYFGQAKGGAYLLRAEALEEELGLPQLAGHCNFPMRLRRLAAALDDLT